MGCGGSKEDQSGGSSAPLPGEESRGGAATAAAAESTAGGSQIEGPFKAYSGEQAHVSATPGEWEEGVLSEEGEAEGPGTSMNHGSSNLGSMKGDLIRLRIIHINDVYELENLPRFATCVQEYKSRDAEDQCQTIVMLPGDFLAPSLLSSLDHGFGMVDCLNMCGVDYACFGNHETDVPHAELVKRIQESKFKWINTNMTDINLGSDVGKLPTHEVITVTSASGHTKRVAILGLLTDDKGLYRPGAFDGAKIGPIIEAATSFLGLIPSEADLILPMTHQVIREDSAMVQHFSGKFPGGDNENAFPLVIGAHDHEPYTEEVSGSCIVKCGCDAKLIGVSRIVWPTAGSRRVTVTTEMRPISEFTADAKVEAAVHSHMMHVRELDSAPLFVWNPEKGLLTSKNNRMEETTLCTQIVSTLRDALGSDCCILNAGNIRGGRDYPPDHTYFTYNDLKAEMPFDAEMIAIPIPGKILSEAVAWTRAKSLMDPPQSFGGFLHMDDGMRFDRETRALTVCGGKPFDEKRVYQVGVLFMVMTGVDDVEPLVKYAEENPQLFPIDKSAEMGRPAKLLLVDYMSKAILFQLGGFKEIDADDKGFINKDDITRAVEKHFSKSVGKIVVNNILKSADINEDGVISREEMLRAVMVSAIARQSIDLDLSGTLDRDEVRNFIRRVISPPEEDVQRLVDMVFSEHGIQDNGHIEQSHVFAFVRKSFNILSVQVPGQSLERGEIKAAMSRLLEKSESSLSDKPAPEAGTEVSKSNGVDH